MKINYSNTELVKYFERLIIMILKAKCSQCDKSFDLEVEKEDFVKYTNGAFIQDCFPYLSTADRELLISSTCGDCFDEMFGMFE